MSQNIWCRFFFIHKYEIISEEPMTDVRNNVVGKVIISRCTNCGKIYKKKIYTEVGHERD